MARYARLTQAGEVVDCSKCEHQKIPPTEPLFYIYLVIILSKTS